MLMRFDPFREIDRLADQSRGALWSGGRPPVMPMDAYRQGDTVVVRFDLPGVTADSIELTVEKNVLTVKADRRWPKAEGDEIIASERPQGTFTRQLFLGEGLDFSHVDAAYDAGVLTLTIPVAEQMKPRRVQISSGSPAQPIPAESSAA